MQVDYLILRFGTTSEGNESRKVKRSHAFDITVLETRFKDSIHRVSELIGWSVASIFAVFVFNFVLVTSLSRE